MKELSLEHAKIIADDTEAAALLLAEGALSGLVPDAPYDTISAFWRSADTHTYIYATYSRVPGDKGYVVIQFPFEHYTEEEAETIARALHDANNLFPGTGITYYEDLAAPNN